MLSKQSFNTKTTQQSFDIENIPTIKNYNKLSQINDDLIGLNYKKSVKLKNSNNIINQPEAFSPEHITEIQYLNTIIANYGNKNTEEQIKGKNFKNIKSKHKDKKIHITNRNKSIIGQLKEIMQLNYIQKIFENSICLTSKKLGLT